VLPTPHDPHFQSFFNDAQEDAWLDELFNNTNA